MVSNEELFGVLKWFSLPAVLTEVTFHYFYFTAFCDMSYFSLFTVEVIRDAMGVQRKDGIKQYSNLSLTENYVTSNPAVSQLTNISRLHNIAITTWNLQNVDVI